MPNQPLPKRSTEQWPPEGGTPTSPPTLDSPVGGCLLEAGGEELASSTRTVAELPYLPLLGATGYLVRGWSHLVAGYPRVGKTDLLVAAVREWLDAGLSVLYITEEPRVIWEFRLAGQTADWSGLRVVFGLGAEPEQLRQRARDGDEQIVIVDALRNLLRLQDERDNSEVARVINPWIADARAAKKTFIAAHHTRKGGGDHGEGISGGHAFLGLVDVALEVLRDPNQARNRRLLRSHARLIEGREALYERAEDGKLTLLGDPTVLQRDEVARRLLSVVTDDFKSTSELRETLGEPKPSHEQVRLALIDLAKRHQILRDPPIEDGQQAGRTYKWASSRIGSKDPETSNGLSYGLEVRFPDTCGSTRPLDDTHTVNPVNPVNRLTRLTRLTDVSGAAFALSRSMMATFAPGAWSA